MFLLRTPKNFGLAMGAVFTLICVSSLTAQTTLPRLHNLDRSARNPFLVQGCHAVGCTHDEPAARGFLPIDNYDMGPSIARSDSFDVAHYDLFLDVTGYNTQSLDAHASITFSVLLGGGTSMWWDLKGLVVDSVKWNG
ncbi:MAG: hypothetical protein ACPG9S_08530, partial [Flavobacteriales bacterium]